jgi:hypothetical protein
MFVDSRWFALVRLSTQLSGIIFWAQMTARRQLLRPRRSSKFVIFNNTAFWFFFFFYNSYTVPFSREDMRGIIYSDVPCHLCTIQARKWWSFKTSNRRRRFFWSEIFVCVIFSHSSWSSRLWLAFALSRSYHRMICADFKTIKSFLKWSQNDHVFSDRTFWVFFHVWSFYFMLNSCMRNWHSTVIESIIRETWWW